MHARNQQLHTSTHAQTRARTHTRMFAKRYVYIAFSPPFFFNIIFLHVCTGKFRTVAAADGPLENSFDIRFVVHRTAYDLCVRETEHIVHMCTGELVQHFTQTSVDYLLKARAYM